MLTIIGSIVSWFASSGLTSIGDQLNRAWESKLRAQTSHDKLEADKTIATLNAQQAVLIKEQGSWMTRWIRPAFALPFVVYDFKIVVWDKVLGLGTTDALSPEFWQLQMIVFGAYFLTRPFEKR